MAKKKSKKNTGNSKLMSPEQFLREKARGLKIGKCYMSEHIEKAGEGHFVVTRLHENGKISIAVYLVDIFCLGVKDSFFKLRMEDYEYDTLLSRLSEEGIRECSYEEAHNWIYGAVAFAEEAGIEPDKSFNLTEYMLEEDTEDIPLIEHDFGKNGKHFLVVYSNLEASKYLPTMRKHLNDNFEVLIEDDNDFKSQDDDDDDFYDQFNREDNPLFKTYGPDVEYSYVHPEYPQTLEVENQWILPELCDPKNDLALPDELIDKLLSLPHDSLRRDLENIILYFIGQTCDNLPEDEDFNGVIGNCVMLLAEVGNNGSSLDVVLEVLRQSPDFYDYHISDAAEQIFVPTLYKLGQDNLDKLMSFAKEEGLYAFAKYQVFPAVAQIALRQPERREEIIEWFRTILIFAKENLPQSTAIDATIAGLMVGDLMGIQAKELLNEIRDLYATGLVDLGCSGDYNDAKREICHPTYPYINTVELEIHKRFDFMRPTF